MCTGRATLILLCSRWKLPKPLLLNLPGCYTSAGSKHQRQSKMSTKRLTHSQSAVQSLRSNRNSQSLFRAQTLFHQLKRQPIALSVSYINIGIIAVILRLLCIMNISSTILVNALFMRMCLPCDAEVKNVRQQTIQN